MKKVSLLLLILLLFTMTISAQKDSTRRDSTKIIVSNVVPPDNNFKPDVVPLSPTAFAFQKFVDVPVSLYTGVPSVNIPIYTIVAKEIKIPISLNYHAGGNRVEELASWVGLGWVLQATGVINKTVRGKIDNSHFNPNYWCKNQFANQGVDYSPFLNAEVLADYQKLNLLANGDADPAPDIYSFNFLGYSGKFIVTDTITMIPLQPFKIRPLNNSGGNAFDTPTGFEIITDDGTKYTFLATEYARIKNESIDYATSFYLSTIQTQTGTIISFEYTDYTQNNRSLGYSESAYYQKVGNNYNQIGSLTSSTSPVRTYGKTLSKITFPNGTVDFITQNDRTDYGESRLEKIIVKDANNTVTKKFKLNNNAYFNDGINSLNVRLKLESLVELAPSQSQETDGIKHTFIYEELVNLPERYSKSIDHWGFYNGKNNTYLTPNLLPSIACNGLLDLSSREPNINFAVANILKTIVYPTGGNSSFEYEANEYLDNSSTATRTSKSVSAVTGETTEAFFTITNPNSCDNILIDINRPDPEEGGANKICEIKFYRIDENNQRVFVVGFNNVSQNGTRPWSFSVGSYVMVAKCNIPNSYADATVNYSLNSIDFNNKITGGLRVKKITTHDALDNTKDLTETFAYRLKDDTNKSSGVPFSFPDYALFSTAFVVVSCSGTEGCCGDEVPDARLNSGSTISVGSDNIVGYKDVTVSTITPTKSYKEISSFSTDAYGFQDSDASWKRGLLLEKSGYNANNQIVSKTVNTYTTLPIGNDPEVLSKVFWGLKVFYEFKHPCSSNDAINVNFPRRYAQTATRSFTEWQVLEKTVETTFEYANNIATALSQESRYYYDNFTHKQISKTIVKTSKNEQIITAMKYPNDFTDAVSRGMIAKNVLNPVLEKTMTLFNPNGSTTSLINYQKTTFQQYQNNFYLPAKIETKVGNGILQTAIDFLGYDSRGNLNGFRTRDGQTVYLEWYTPADAGKTDLLKKYIVGGGNDGLVLSREIFYDYKPLVGLSLISDINDYEITFQYDGYNRFLSKKDPQNYLLEDYHYHYADEIISQNLGISPNNSMSYVVSRTARTEQTGTELSTDVNNTTTKIQYADGLGRNLQALIWQGTPDKTKDLITGTTEYNAFGNAHKEILPTPSDGVLGEYKFGVEGLAQSFYGDNSPSTETVFEISPMNRPIKQFGAGQAWRNTENEKFVAMQYMVAGTDVKQFNIQSNGTIDASTSYLENSLSNMITTSERGFWTKEFKDKQGRVVAKMQQLSAAVTAITGYCYDDLGRLRYVIPPEIYKQFEAGTVTSFTEADEIFKEGMYGYHYDEFGKQIEKHVPGGGWRYSVFDKHDREVMFADDEDKAKGYWQFRKFDALSREISSGLINNIGGFSRSQLQSDFDNFTGQSYETISNAGLLGYTNVSFPSSYTPEEANVMEVKYFDDYAIWQTETAYNFNPSTAFHAQGLTKGLTTGMLSRNIETNDWLKSVNYYDYKGRLIQSFFKNHKGNIERSDFQYRFNGEVLKMVLEHEGINEVYDYEYSHLGVKTSFKHTLNGTLKNVAKYEQDNINRLKTKKLSPQNNIGSVASGSWNSTNTWQNNGIPSINDYVRINAGHTITINSGEAGSAGSLFNAGTLNTFGRLDLGVLSHNTVVSDLQTVDYSYHIRGGLRGINLDANSNPSLAGGKLFSFKLGYEEDNIHFDNNISSQTWLSAVDNLSRSYSYNYDGASRILGANFTGGKPNENYSLENMNYDFNGNIKSLWRKGMIQNNTFDYTDKLGYTYANNSNKLSSVSDVISGNLNTGDFRDGNTSGDDYEYWLDGSLKKDLNKGIFLIEYNYLKLHKKITFSDGRTINFQYDASGKKLKEIASNGDVTDYFGNLIKKNDILYQISHDEGRIVNGNYEYNITDHLGNLRMSFKDSLGIAKITQAQDYEPFGLENWTSKFVNNSKISNFKFNGIEKQEEANLYLAKFRGLDSQTGRWTQIDPKPNSSISLYSVMMNNPIRYTDPLGDTTVVNNYGMILKQYGGNNIVYQQGKKGKLTNIGSFGKSINLTNILPNILKRNQNVAKSLSSLAMASNTNTALLYANLVRPGGLWDYKNTDVQKGNIFGATASYEDLTKQKTSFTSGKLNFVEGGSDIGNYNYGYTGRYVGGEGYSHSVLWAAGGALQISKDFVKGDWGKVFSELNSVIPISRPPFGDEHDDFIWTTIGMKQANDEKKENK